MSKVQKFEELIAWQKARVLTKAIYETTNQANFAKDFGLRDQIRRASVSVMSNIAEGFERRTRRDFAHFLTMAKASAGEVRSQLYVAYDVSYIAEPGFTELIALSEEVSRIIAGLSKSIERT